MAVIFGLPILEREAGMNDGSIPDALTFDDVLLLPGRSTVLPTEVDTTTNSARKVRLHVPLASAAMDTVTESRLAIAIARQGGIGIVHRSMPAEKQAEEVDRVKRSESGMIVDPVTISPDITIRQALEIMNKYKISGLPVTRGSRLTGILTNRDLRFEKTHSQLVSSVMTKENLVTVPVGTTLDEAERILQKHRIEKLLVVDQDFNLKGLITVKDIQKKLEYPRAAKDEHGRLRVGAAIGATGDFLERAVELSKAKVDVLAIDTAHGHSFRVMEAIKAIRHRLPDVQLIAGNVATYEGTKELISLGVDGLKVGIGPGSICTTRVVTGAGVGRILRDDWKPVCRNGRVTRRNHSVSGTHIQVVSRDGFHRRDGSWLRSLCYGSGYRRTRQVRAGRRGRTGSVQRPAIRLEGTARGRAAQRNGLCWREHTEGIAREEPLHSRHRRRTAREPRPRRHHHERSAELSHGVRALCCAMTRKMSELGVLF